MKIFALLGLASLVYADNDGNVVRRRRLALQKCSFPALRAGAHDPNCLGMQDLLVVIDVVFFLDFFLPSCGSLT